MNRWMRSPSKPSQTPTALPLLSLFLSLFDANVASRCVSFSVLARFDGIVCRHVYWPSRDSSDRIREKKRSFWLSRKNASAAKQRPIQLKRRVICCARWYNSRGIIFFPFFCVIRACNIYIYIFLYVYIFKCIFNICFRMVLSLSLSLLFLFLSFVFNIILTRKDV